ncbi:MAG: hypothetical protein C5B50_17610 [Verrucomicrobia bacterium]|nr:MAG: hypothetical protein C5B50_17610 [Verrucomicrobiota bacterium]
MFNTLDRLRWNHRVESRDRGAGESACRTPGPLELHARKITSQFGTIARSYGLTLWPKEEKWKYQHDFEVMLAHEDLDSIRLELLAQDNSVLFEFKIHFSCQTATCRRAEINSGVELPVIQRETVANHRIVLQHHRKIEAYRHLLKLNWGPVETFQKRPGDTFASDHASKITGGRQQANFHVASEVRQCLTVTQTGNGPYAFAEGMERGRKGVYLHLRFAPPGFRFRVGQQLTALLVQTTRGIQARAIRAN